MCQGNLKKDRAEGDKIIKEESKRQGRNYFVGKNIDIRRINVQNKIVIKIIYPKFDDEYL